MEGANLSGHKLNSVATGFTSTSSKAKRHRRGCSFITNGKMELAARTSKEESDALFACFRLYFSETEIKLSYHQ